MKPFRTNFGLMRLSTALMIAAFALLTFCVFLTTIGKAYRGFMIASDDFATLQAGSAWGSGILLVLGIWLQRRHP